MASTPPKLAIAAILLVGLWVITYWITPVPAPAEQPIKISFGDSPQSGDAAQPPVPRIEEPKPEPAPPAPTPQDEPPPKKPHDDILVEVSPEELPGSEPVEIAPPTFRVYYSAKGDTFQSIAKRFFGSPARWRTVANANPAVDPNRFGPGTRILIPLDPENIQGKVAEDPQVDPTAEPQGAPPILEPEYTEYIVQRGDTLSGISKSLYGRASLWQMIAEANPTVDANRLRPGTTLHIPPPPARN